MKVVRFRQRIVQLQFLFLLLCLLVANSGSVQIARATAGDTPSGRSSDQESVRLWNDARGDLWVETPFYRWNITGGTSITALSSDKAYEWNVASQTTNVHVLDELFLIASAEVPTTTRIFYALPDEGVVYLERKAVDGTEGLEVGFRASDGLIRFTHRWQGTNPPAIPLSRQSPVVSAVHQTQDRSDVFSSRDGQLTTEWSYSLSFDPIALQGQAFISQAEVQPAQPTESSCFTEFASAEPSVHDPCQFPNFFLPGQAVGTEYLLLYTADSADLLNPMEQAIAALQLSVPDLDVAYIGRTPRYDYDAPKNKPAPGDVVTFQARIANRGGQSSGVFEYDWYIDQVLVQSGTYPNLDVGQEITLSINWTWQDGPHTVRLDLDSSNTIGEVSEQNNSVEDRTNGLAVGFWVEQSVYDYFNLHQVERGLGNVSWDDYAQTQLRMWNQMLANAVHPLTPQGIIDRVRLDKVTVVPDGTLLGSNRPVQNDKTVDLMWGFIGYAYYVQSPSAQDFDPALLHELSHARYLVDLYGLDVSFGAEHLSSAVTSTATTLTVGNNVESWQLPAYLAVDGELIICQAESGNSFVNCQRGAEGTSPRAHAAAAIVNEAAIRLQDGQGNLIMNSPAMPLLDIWDDHVYYNRNPQDVMSGGLVYETHSAYAWNRIAGQRPICGNYNAPCNIGVYLNDLPLHNVVEIQAADGQTIQGARVELFQARPKNGWYSKVYLNTPDLTYYTDALGRVDLGHFPFGAGPNIVHWYGYSNADLLLKISYGEQSYYHFFEVTEANEAYWSGQQNSATYIFDTDIVPFDCAGVTQIPQAECQVLVNLYDSTQGINWNQNINWLVNTTPCNWYGVGCTAGHISSLYLPLNQLTGSIPIDLNNLTQLKVLDLSRNQLSGTIPNQLGNLSSLENLALYNNQLTGSIPSELGNLEQLVSLALNENQLTGPIPTTFGDLTELHYLWLHDNQLTGSIPAELSNLSQLTYLRLENNQLSGGIPTALSALTQLTDLQLANNQLTGNIPVELGNLTQLTKLNLQYNQLTGSIPAELGNLTQLEYLALNNNQLTGSIPSTLGNLTELLSLWLSSNQLTGGIPAEFGNLSQLLWLILNDNKLSGEFPPSITNLTNLTNLTFDCWITSSDPTVIAFIDARVPGWQNKICPIVSSITRADPDPTSAESADFTVIFSEQVSGVNADDFSLSTTGVTDAAIIAVVPVTGTNYTVTVNTGSGNGTIRLDLVDDDSIQDIASNTLGGSGAGNGDFTSGETYEVNKISTLQSKGVEDGWILESTETSNKGGSKNSSAATFNLGDNAANKQYRSILSFNTSALPEGAVITKLTLNLKKAGVSGGGNPITIFKGLLVDVKKGDFGTAALELGDFKLAGDLTLGPFKPALERGWYSLDLTTAGSWINTDGNTQLRLRFKLDDNNNFVANYLKLYSGNAASANQPQLIIEYYTP